MLGKFSYFLYTVGMFRVFVSHKRVWGYIYIYVDTVRRAC